MRLRFIRYCTLHISLFKMVSHEENTLFNSTAIKYSIYKSQNIIKRNRNMESLYVVS